MKINGMIYAFVTCSIFLLVLMLFVNVCLDVRSFLLYNFKF